MRNACTFYLSFLFIAIVCAVPAHAEEPGWVFSGRFSGSSNSSGLILKTDPSAGYNFNRSFQTYFGMPFYFVNQTSTSSTATSSTTTANGSLNGIGNAYGGVRFVRDGESLDFSSNLEMTAPTGDKDRGFSTGHPTVDWTNTFSHSFSALRPFGSLGIANTVSDTAFFVRPFSSLGFVSHFEGGATAALTGPFRVGASAYDVQGAGDQRIISKVKGRGQGSGSVGASDLVNDHGFSTWLSVLPGSSNLSFQIGYSRSVNYDLNSLSFGVGFRIGK
jgi:hypothetical protein